ncbi:MAG: hypothetical protein ACP5RH_11340 [Leptodesmis sp.]
MTMLWNTDVTIQGKTFRLPDDIRELWIEADSDKLYLEAGEVLIIDLTNGDQVEYLAGTDAALDAALQECLDPL